MAQNNPHRANKIPVPQQQHNAFDADNWEEELMALEAQDAARQPRCKFRVTKFKAKHDEDRYRN